MKKLPILSATLFIFISSNPGCQTNSSASMNNERSSKNSPQENNPHYSRTDTTPLTVPDSEWKKILPENVYKIAREKGTERAFTGKYDDFYEKGTYYCAVCGNALFRSDSKFSSGCGWPSFFETIRKGSIIYKPDNSYGMFRTETLCGRCNSHLGHVFDDGPPPTGKRYCMNSAVLEFEPEIK